MDRRLLLLFTWRSRSELCVAGGAVLPCWVLFRLGVFRFSREWIIQLDLEHLLENQFGYLFRRLRLIFRRGRNHCLAETVLLHRLPVDDSVYEIDRVAVRG